MGGQQDLSGNGRRYETEILCTEHVPLPLGCRSARGTSAGIHRFGHLRPLQTTARLQRTEPYGLRRLRLASRAVCHSNWPTPCNYYRQQYQPLSRTARQDRLLVRLEPRDTHLRPRILPLDAMGFPADVPELLRQQVAEGTAHRPAGEGFRSKRHRRTGRGL